MIDGSMLIGGGQLMASRTFRVTAPASGVQTAIAYSDARLEDVAEACRLAEAAFDDFRGLGDAPRAALLRRIADDIEALGDTLPALASEETGLSVGQLDIEAARTVLQLRLFADLVASGTYAEVVAEPAAPGPPPVGRPAITRRNIGVGPVAVFCASNFPLAFSVAGGDTVAALAAGCPVVVRGHPAHAGTAEMVGRVIQNAVAALNLPAGVFSLLPGVDHAVGGALVADPRIMAVGFTGSRAGGLALQRIGQARPEPIPVHAEMSSINPVVLFPGALENRAEAIAAEFIASLTLGAGQFCTNPGLILASEGPALDRFLAASRAKVEGLPPAVMLTIDMKRRYDAGLERIKTHPQVACVAGGQAGQGVAEGQAVLWAVDAETFLAAPALAEEVFGASAIVVRCRDLAQIRSILQAIEGQLTITLQMDPEDHAAARELTPLMERKAGRLLANGWPTGVAVGAAMVHGGPFPATSDPRFTSVGLLSIRRFLRPVAYQNFPESVT